jgi:hypothetical protein
MLEDSVSVQIQSEGFLHEGLRIHSESPKESPHASLQAPSLKTHSGGPQKLSCATPEAPNVEGSDEVSEGPQKGSCGLLDAPDSEVPKGASIDLPKAPSQATTGDKVVDKSSGPGCSGATPGLSKGSKDLPNEIAREKRERKAAKADDAVVPEFLCEEHLF